MREITYKLELAGNGYVVHGGNGSFEDFSTYRHVGDFHAIHMRFARGANDEARWRRLLQYIDSDYFDLANLGEDFADDFARNIVEIMMGNCPEWALYAFYVFPGGVQLFYANAKTGDPINFWIHSNPSLDLIFEESGAKPGTRSFYHLECNYIGTGLEEIIGGTRRLLQFQVKDPNNLADDIFHTYNTVMLVTEFIGI